MTTTEKNWAGNIAYKAQKMHTPESVETLRSVVKNASAARALGSRHSFNRIADTDADLISLRKLNRMINLDRDARTVTIEGGMTYGELGPLLEAEGFALHNLASLPHISVAGACATATHGSGMGNGNLATAIAALKIMTGEGNEVTFTRGEADFDGAAVHLGALGIVTEVTLDLQISYEVRQNLYRDLPIAALTADFDTLAGSAYSVSFFTKWTGDTLDQVWLKALAETPEHTGDFYGARPADGPVHPIPEVDPTPCTQQMGVPGPWNERLSHFRNEFTPSVGAELQSEYFVARKDAAAAINALHAVQDGFSRHLMISEIRTIAADSFWMSPNYQEDSVAFHFTFQPDRPNVQKALPVIEAALKPFGFRAHWGKLFTMTPEEVQAGFPRIGDFRDLVRRTDPDGKFANDFLKTYVL